MLEPFFGHEPADEPDDRRTRGPSQRLARALARLAIGPEMVHVDAGRNRPRRLLPSALVEHAPRGVPECDQAVGAPHRRSLDPVERRQIALDDVLERREHERVAQPRRARNLRGRCDVRLLPAVDDVPWFLQQLHQLAAVQHHVDAAAEVHGHGDDMAWLVGPRRRRVPAEVAAEARRRDGRHVPASGAGELLWQSSIQLHAVRVRDGQQSAASGHACFLSTVEPWGSATEKMMSLSRSR